MSGSNDFVRSEGWTGAGIPFARNFPLHAMIVAFLLYWIYTAIHPTDRIQWAMESLLPVGTLVALGMTYRKFRFSNRSYFWMFVFLCVHTFAAHYTYQGTPVDAWLKAAYHTKRSYFDRVVHLLFGLIWTYPCRELLVRTSSLRGFWSYALPAAVVFGMSSLFEIVEMVAALVAKQSGEQYVGLQGDVFDSQKDMSLGLAGAVVSMGALAWLRNRAGREERAGWNGTNARAERFVGKRKAR
ncbi:DUF2238 domain-containing protein [Paenibacillus flagellatus]|uniref:DUF2238 domain-containing protein n=1 Tax=Paenibacillus flagellatus TaxID=2211139 RepID=A0A2V5KUZ7_9BACL|nr:DUF2238 domain-containing protein [Paenibacillus flagellatus]PYI55857.1 DUF2238 domain-containing protein [Paenibacillus flagellatus]